MSDRGDHVPQGTSPRTDASPPVGVPGPAALASIGAGAIHAAAIGIHGEHVGLTRLFVAVAVFQVAWGVLALLRRDRWVAVVGAVGNLVIVGGWLASRLTGIGLVDGLEVRESPQLADSIAALLGVIAGIGSLVAVLADRSASPRRPALLAVSAVAVIALAAPAMATTSGHDHGQGTELAAGHGDGHTDGDGHGDGHSDGHGDDHSDGPVTPPAPGGEAAAPASMVSPQGHDHEVPATPRPYDPRLPIDLSGVEGVTPEQQARAENLVAITLLRLPRFTDPAVAEAEGFRSIGDGFTGYEHYINWSYLNDDKVLDPDYPESLVYQVQGGVKTLVSAMFMLGDEATLDSVPDIGGQLTQWHIHDDLCFSADPASTGEARVVGLTGADGTCTFGVKLRPNPMIHVWITPHPCGPFAALEGVAAGQIRPGDERWCDTAHGSH